MKSLFRKLNLRDVAKSIAMTIGGFVASSVTDSISGGQFDSHQIAISAKVGLISGVVYLVKNFFTNSNDQLFKGE